jgi:hypothetical protein
MREQTDPNEEVVVDNDDLQWETCTTPSDYED